MYDEAKKRKIKKNDIIDTSNNIRKISNKHKKVKGETIDKEKDKDKNKKNNE